MCNPQREDLERMRIAKRRLEQIKKNLRKTSVYYPKRKN